MFFIAPSILAADFSRLGEQVREVEKGGADRIHVDVMDGHFVPNLSMGPEVLRGLKRVTDLPLEVHLMVEDPGRFIDAFIREGADTLIIHQEVLPDPVPLLKLIRSRGKKAGLAFKPKTAVAAVVPFLAECDLALCMTVEPGFGGQAFLPESLERIRELRKSIDTLPKTCELEVDGGINLKTAQESRVAGATVFVIGSALFQGSQKPLETMQCLRSQVKDS